MEAYYKDRRDAGRALAGLLGRYAGRPRTVVLGLPRGGVIVAAEVAGALGAPLDVFVVRKLGLPHQPELAMGAIASGHVRVLNRDVVDRAGVSPEAIEEVARRETAELERRERVYRGGRRPHDVGGKTVILVDDGLATGATMRAAVEALRRLGPSKIVAAVPVAAASSCRELSVVADEMVCASTPEPFYGVGGWYENFADTTDDEVREALSQAEGAGAAPGQGGGS